jgi:biotin carboxyl carrier protein
MNLKVKIENRIFNVQIGNTKVRPILVQVEGDLFEVWPEHDSAYPHTNLKMDIAENSSGLSMKTTTLSGDHSPLLKSKLSNLEELTPLQCKSIRAPIPGLITSVSVRVGSEVAVGEELLKLEAMKMNNSIRSNRSGIISAVNVAIGQIVKLNEILLEFTS